MSVYRLLAKTVAIVDLVLSTIFLLLAIALLILAGVVATAADDKNLEDQIQQIVGPNVTAAAGFVNTAIWVSCVVAIITVIQIWTGIRLLSATQSGCINRVEALRLTSTWWNVSVVLLVLETIGLLVLGMYISFAINLVLRGVMICIVFRYMVELNR